MRRIPFVLGVLIVIVVAISGRVSGEVSEIDLSAVPDINTQDVLTHEDAIVLSSSYDAELKKNWKAEYNFTKRIKLLSDKACQMYGEIQVRYLKKMQRVPLLKGYTITPEGKKVVAKKITDYMPQREIPVYGDQAVKVLSMRGLSKGCEIEYTYKIKSDDLGLIGLFNDFYMFSETVPVKNARFSVKVPKYTPLYYVSNKAVTEPEIEKKSSYKTYTWKASNVEPIKFEENMPPIRTFTSWVSVSTSDSWDDYILAWKKIYNLRAALNPKIKKKVTELVKGTKKDSEKAEKIFNYVQNKIRFLGLEFGRAGWIPYSAAKVFKSKYGDCKGKTVLTIAMLKAAKIKAYPVMLNMRANGPVIKDMCNETQFSHIIPVCEIDGELVWMDPTSKAAFGTLPGPLQGVDALVIKEEGGFYVTPLSTAEDNKIQMHAKVKYTPSGTAEGTINMEGTGNNSTFYRELMAGLSTELKEQFVQTLLNQWVPGATVKMYNYSDYLDNSSSMKLEFEFSSNRQAERINDMLIISPIFKRDPRMEFIKKERFYDIELDIKESIFKKEEIIKPDGFRFDVIPQDYDKKTPHFKAYIKHKADGEILIREVYFEWLKTKVPKNEYSNFKQNLDDFELWTNKKIILRKM